MSKKKQTDNQNTYKLKICGLKYLENIHNIAKQVQPEYMGFIFYEKSKRFVGEDFDPNIINAIPTNIQKVGVFVNADKAYILRKIKWYQLEMVQLHGDETPLLCSKLKNMGVKVMKVFSVGNSFDFEQLTPYEKTVDYFLFDTKGKNYGGNGIRFNWQILKTYNSPIPLFLSGGIGLDSIGEIRQLQSTEINIYALDVNSKFEIEPARKDINQLLDFKKQLPFDSLDF